MSMQFYAKMGKATGLLKNTALTVEKKKYVFFRMVDISAVMNPKDW